MESKEDTINEHSSSLEAEAEEDIDLYESSKKTEVEKVYVCDSTMEAAGEEVYVYGLSMKSKVEMIDKFTFSLEAEENIDVYNSLIKTEVEKVPVHDSTMKSEGELIDKLTSSLDAEEKAVDVKAEGEMIARYDMSDNSCLTKLQCDQNCATELGYDDDDDILDIQAAIHNVVMNDNVLQIENVIGTFCECLKQSNNSQNDVLDMHFEHAVNLMRDGVGANHVFKDDFGYSINKGWTLLHFVCYKGSPGKVKALIELGANPSLVDICGNTPLHIACKYGHFSCIKPLLVYDSTLKDVCNKQGITPLMHAICRVDTAFKHGDYVKTIDELISVGCDVNISPVSNRSPLHVASAKRNCTKVVLKLLQAGANVNADTGSMSPLMEALCCSHVDNETVSVLIDAGADVNYKNSNGKSVLHVAVAKSEDICVEHLLKAGANTNLEDNDGYSPLWIAVSENNIKITPYLLQYGGDVNFTLKDTNMSLLCVAASKGYEDMLELLLKYNANVNLAAYLDTPALHFAVNNNQIQSVKLLLSKNCDLDDYSTFKNLYNPQNALQIAFCHGNADMIKLLILAGFPIQEHLIKRSRLAKVVLDNEELVDWLYNYFYNPRSLLHLCRVQIRKLYRSNLLTIVQILTKESMIPQRLADTILMTDVLHVHREIDDFMNLR